MQCPACHNEVSSENAFCNHCGAPMQAAAEPHRGRRCRAPAAYAVQPLLLRAPGCRRMRLRRWRMSRSFRRSFFLSLSRTIRCRWSGSTRGSRSGCASATILQVLVVDLREGCCTSFPGSFFLFWLVHLVLAWTVSRVDLFVILKASKGEWYKLPVIGDFAEKQARS